MIKRLQVEVPSSISKEKQIRPSIQLKPVYPAIMTNRVGRIGRQVLSGKDDDNKRIQPAVRQSPKHDDWVLLPSAKVNIARQPIA